MRYSLFYRIRATTTPQVINESHVRFEFGWVLGHHSKYEIADFLRNPSSAKHPASSGDETPIECESRSVPTHNGFWTHNNESLFPLRPEPSRQNPEELIERRYPRPGMSSRRSALRARKNRTTAPIRSPMAAIMRGCYRISLVDGNSVSY
jgi:hypothetical protein